MLVVDFPHPTGAIYNFNCTAIWQHIGPNNIIRELLFCYFHCAIILIYKINIHIASKYLHNI